MSNISTYYHHHHHQQQNHSSFNNNNTNNNNNPHNNNNNNPMTDDLPKQFVSSLRILFDILDENHSGFVRLSDIESRWKEDGVKGLPSGVVDALKKVTPANGYLNFDRFVAGLKLVLWRNKHGQMISSDEAKVIVPYSDESQLFDKDNNTQYHNFFDDEEEDIKKPIINMGQSVTDHQHHFNLSNQFPNNFSNRQFNSINKQSNISSTDVFGTSCAIIPTGTNNFTSGSASRPNYPQTNNLGYQNNYSLSTSTTLVTTATTSSGYLRSSNPCNTSFSHNNINNDLVPPRTTGTLNEEKSSLHPASSSSVLPGDKMASPPQIQQQQRLLPYVTRCPERPLLQPPRQQQQPQNHHHPYNIPVSDMPDHHHHHPSIENSALTNPQQQTFSAPPQIPPRDQKANILNELKNWQKQRMKKNFFAPPPAVPSDNNTRRVPSEWSSTSTRNNHPTTTENNTKDVDRNNYVNIENFQQRRNPEEYGTKKSNELRHSARRWDGRRHTLTSGVDHSMIKRMRQLEEEKEMLVQGLEIVESAKLWYQKRLALIHDKQKLTACSSVNDSSLEANQERMNFQKTRISEVNQQLKTLIESSERGFPLHMNLAISNTGHPLTLEDNGVKILKEQNRQLTQEISTKCDKITQLEQEKTALIRELFESRSRNKPSLDDTTFM